MTGKGGTEELRQTAQCGTWCPLFALPLHCSISPSVSRWRCLCPLQQITILLTLRAPRRGWNPKQFFFLPFKEGKGHPKCPIFWLCAKCGWKLSPKASLSSRVQHRAWAIKSLRLLSASGKVHSWKAADNWGWNTAETRRVLSQIRVLTEGLSYHLGPQDKDSNEVRRGCWL